jgi:hypothetical protein
MLTEITRNYRGAHARLEVLSPDIGCQVQAENRPFDGIAADVNDRGRTVWIHFTGLNHGIQRARSIRIIPRSGEGGPVVEIEDQDGTKTILTLANPGDYDLPPAQEPGRK